MLRQDATRLLPVLTRNNFTKRDNAVALRSGHVAETVHSRHWRTTPIYLLLYTTRLAP